MLFHFLSFPLFKYLFRRLKGLLNGTRIIAFSADLKKIEEKIRRLKGKTNAGFARTMEPHLNSVIAFSVTKQKPGNQDRRLFANPHACFPLSFLVLKGSRHCRQMRENAPNATCTVISEVNWSSQSVYF